MSEKKKISIMVPCYNEEENVVPLSEAAIATLEKDLPEYDYEILFIDNCYKLTFSPKRNVVTVYVFFVSCFNSFCFLFANFFSVYEVSFHSLFF